jgi:hypothetical protein
MGERADWTGTGTDHDTVQPPLHRRNWLKVALLGLLTGLTASLRGQEKKKAPLTPDDEKAVDALRAQAKKAGLPTFEATWTDHFLGVGDGPPRYRAEALDHCEAIGRDFLAHFRKRGFKLDYPGHRLSVVPLRGVESYGAFIGDKPDAEDGGRYELDSRWLVIFDFRPESAKPAARRVNTFTLVHETIHLLCFNTGLLSPQDDVPDCISEGLATYGELWTPPRAPSAFGAVNRPRLTALLGEMEGGTAWIPISRLIADNEVLRNPATAQMAYAESWLLVHFLLESEERLPKFRAYLAGLPKLGESRATSREKYAESKLGSLRELDLAVRRHAQRMARKAGLRVPAGLSRGRD